MCAQVRNMAAAEWEPLGLSRTSLNTLQGEKQISFAMKYAVNHQKNLLFEKQKYKSMKCKKIMQIEQHFKTKMFALPLTEESGNWAVPPKRGEFMCQLARQISQNVCRHRTVHRWCIRVLVLRNKGKHFPNFFPIIFEGRQFKVTDCFDYKDLISR